jgi:hypothetical protein
MVSKASQSSRKGHSLGSGPTRWLPQAPGGLVTRRISFVPSEHLENVVKRE